MGQEVVSLRERATKLGVEKKTLPGIVFQLLQLTSQTSTQNSKMQPWDLLETV